MAAAGMRMKVIDVPQPGGPEALVLAERPVPQPRAGEVLIEVAAAGLNRAEIRASVTHALPWAKRVAALPVVGS